MRVNKLNKYVLHPNLDPQTTGLSFFLLSPSPTIIWMPFEKIYDQRLQTFPPELRDSSIQYREVRELRFQWNNGLTLIIVQLKQLIGRLVDELNDLGLRPETLRQAVSTAESGGDLPISHMGPPLVTSSEGQIFSCPEGNTVPQRVTYSKILYEVVSDSGKSFPQLRVCMMAQAGSEPPSATDHTNSTECGTRIVSELVHPKIEETGSASWYVDSKRCRMIIHIAFPCSKSWSRASLYRRRSVRLTHRDKICDPTGARCGILQFTWRQYPGAHFSDGEDSFGLLKVAPGSGENDYRYLSTSQCCRKLPSIFKCFDPSWNSGSQSQAHEGSVLYYSTSFYWWYDIYVEWFIRLARDFQAFCGIRRLWAYQRRQEDWVEHRGKWEEVERICG